mmetsp:Transcript_13787/g.29736  ORF Transcript_13787/g.29736 Transcript_13787/m.29736 type:complete len:222 (-) Transcript_13787:300-965(-)
MAGLVDGTCEALQHVIGLEAGGHAHVCRMSTAGEGVDGHIQAAIVQAEANVQSHLLAHLCLCRSVVRADDPATINDVNLGLDSSQERHQPLTHLGEDLVQALSCHSPLIVVQQHIVCWAAGVNVLGLLLVDVDPLLQEGRKLGEVALLAGSYPSLISLSLQLGNPLGEVLGDGGVLLVVTGSTPNDSLRHLIQALAVAAQLPQQLAQLRISALVVHKASQD